MIKLCYKEYSYKMSLKACKVFFEQTGLDLQTVFMRYIVACAESKDDSVMARMVRMSEIYTRNIACKALHAVISQEDKSIPLAEIEDATYRVSWMPNEKEDDISEPWPMVMLDLALQINEYFASGLSVKKTDTSEA
jgi:hypothetical protein